MTPRRQRRKRPSVRLWVVGAVAVGLLVSSTTVATADGTTTTTTLPPAPAGFANSVIAVYQAAATTAGNLGQGATIQPVSQYTQEIDALTPSQLAQFYSVTQSIPEWSQIPSLMETIDGTVPTTANLSASVHRSHPTDAILTAMISRPARTGGVAAAGPAVLTGSTTPVAPFTPQQCDTTDYDVPIFAAQIVLDVSNALYDGSSAFASADNEVAAVIAVIAAVVVTAAAIVHDTLTYLQTLENDCDSNNQSNEIANIDNTTVAAYNLLTTIGSTTATVQTGVQNIQSTLTTFQTTLQQALTSDTQTLQATVGGDTQGTATELQVIQTALQQDSTTIQASETTTGQQVVAGTSTIQTALTADLSQILHETDADAAGLTTLITQGNQQILNAIQTQAASAQSQYNELLRLQIEQALAGWGPVVPEVKFMLPASEGGFLNSTPVGVQSVVTADLASIQAIGGKPKPAAVTDLAAGNTALAAGQYQTAFSYFAGAYQALA
jgi:hypothetical protein